MLLLGGAEALSLKPNGQWARLSYSLISVSIHDKRRFFNLGAKCQSLGAAWRKTLFVSMRHRLARYLSP